MSFLFFFSSRRRHTRLQGDWSSDVCSSDLTMPIGIPRSVTPAACDAWLTALARHGRLGLAEVLAPNIELADGFPVYPRLARAIAMLEERLRQWPTSTAVFLPNGRAPRVGEILVQKDLAALFRQLVA